jgi:hypothetical protein
MLGKRRELWNYFLNINFGFFFGFFFCENAKRSRATKPASVVNFVYYLHPQDAQLELQEKHYEKIKRKSLYWIVFLCLLLAGHAVAFYTVMYDSVGFDILILLSDTLAHATVFVLDLQFLHLVMVLCKRYRLVNKILVHITKVILSIEFPWALLGSLGLSWAPLGIFWLLWAPLHWAPWPWAPLGFARGTD